MYPIIEDLQKINQFESVALPSAKRMYDMYGYRQSLINDSNGIIDLNESKLDNLALMEGFDRYMQEKELRVTAPSISVDPTPEEQPGV